VKDPWSASDPNGQMDAIESKLCSTPAMIRKSLYAGITKEIYMGSFKLWIASASQRIREILSANIFLAILIISCLFYFWRSESISFGLVFTGLWLGFSLFCYEISRKLMVYWVFPVGFLLGFVFFVYLRPDILNDFISLSVNPDKMYIYLIIIVIAFILYFLVVGLLATKDLKVSAIWVIVGIVSPLILHFVGTVGLIPLFLIAMIALCGLVYTCFILFSTLLPFLGLGVCLSYHTNNIYFIIMIIVVLMILIYKYCVKFLMAYVVFAGVGLMVLPFIQYVFSTGDLVIQLTNMFLQITTSQDLLTGLEQIVHDKITIDLNSILTLDYLYNVYLKDPVDKFIILFLSIFISFALSLRHRKDDE